MVRTEKELLSMLFNALHSLKEPEVITKKENDVIEKYRDDEGYINLKNVNDINEIKKVFSIVDKKNFLEQLQYGDNNIQKLADNLASELMMNDSAKSVTVHIDAPTGNACANISKPDDSEMKKPCSENEKATTVNTTTINSITNECTNNVNEDKQVETENIAVALYDVGGMYNPAFYNAALYICETIHFPSCGVYAEDELDKEDNIKTHILLPNVWGKMFAGAADEFGERIRMGEDVFVLDPETFELTKVNNALDLWDYAMTKVQEEMI